MSGKPKQKSYLYDSKGKFLKEFESIKDVQRELFPEVKGIKNPFNVYSGKYIYIKQNILLKNNNLLTKKRIGRDAVKKLFRIINSPFITTRSDDKVIECLNLNNEVIATYKGLHIASLLSNVPKPTIFNQLKNNKGNHTKIDLIFRYK